MRTRIFAAIGLAFIALSVYSDPYTHNLNGSDGFVAAPTWQTWVAGMDIALLAAAVALVLRTWIRAACIVLIGELLYALAYNALLVHRDGIDRFIWGFGAQRHVLDFIVVFGLRVLILVGLLQALRHRESRAA
jgi:hypothetical protein